jgi:DNA-binding GntR family transcriptional regulator
MNRTVAPSLPKYWQLVERFRTQIERGELAPGDRLPSIAEMKTQGVSRPVMDKVHQILEQEGLILRQPGSGTFVSEPRKRVSTGILGVSGWGFDFGAQSSYWGEVLSGLREGAATYGMQLLLLDHGSSKGWEKADGVLICDYDAHQVLQYVPAHLPCVSILVPVEKMASVYID